MICSFKLKVIQNHFVHIIKVVSINESRKLKSYNSNSKSLSDIRIYSFINPLPHCSKFLRGCIKGIITKESANSWVILLESSGKSVFRVAKYVDNFKMSFFIQQYFISFKISWGYTYFLEHPDSLNDGVYNIPNFRLIKFFPIFLPGFYFLF